MGHLPVPKRKHLGSYPENIRCVVEIPELLEVEGGLRLRPWELRDSGLLLAAVEEPFLARMIKLRYRGPRAVGNWIRARRHSLVIVPEGSAVGVGEAALAIDSKGYLGELHGWILPAFRQRGLGGRAAALLCAWADHNLSVVTAVVSDRNLTSRRGLERLGFRRGNRVPMYAGYHRPPYDSVCYYKNCLPGKTVAVEADTKFAWL